MVDIEKKLFSDWNEIVAQEHHIDQKVSAFEKKSADFVKQSESLIEQKATQEVIAKLENNERKDLSLDKALSLNDDFATQHKNSSQSLRDKKTDQSITARIISQNPDSSPQANIWREQSYNTIQSQISSLPFGLDSFFIDA